MINEDLSLRLAGARGRIIIKLSGAAARWGGVVPDDPGIAELADLLEQAAGTFHDETASRAKAELVSGVAHLRAADRLGGLLPAVTLWHLNQTLQRTDAARRA
ncbi:hypothetical protein [Streptomyces sp. NPDC001933]|uniref:hypothetical protein n=1 Tax=Streptomyces sp. NPDC001933 TaxID=3364626 RepID=UPI003674D372